MKYIFRCEKLVRDRIPDLIAGSNGVVEVLTLDRRAHIDALKLKLKEEVEEILAANTKEELIEELADIGEVLDALILKLAISKFEIEEIKRKKNMKNGGFDRGLFLKTVQTDKDSKVAEHFLRHKGKYPFAETA